MLRYKLDDLGWFQFEQLVQSLLKQKLGLGIESWGEHHDFGIDAYFESELEFPTKGKFSKGSFVFQIKFVENANAAGAKPKDKLLSAVKKETGEIRKRMIKNKEWTTVDHYVFITNANLTPSLRKLIREEFNKAFSNTKIYLLGGKDICDWLDDEPNLRLSFPQLLGLRDIENLINQAINKPFFERSRSLLEDAYEYAKVFVPTGPYRKLLNIMPKYYFAVLEGPPEVGKTATAYMIALNKLKEGWEVYDCKNPDDFFNGYNKNAKQIFIADDAFGTTEYIPELAYEWAKEMHRIFRKLDKTHWFIWTTRGHILKIALQKMHLQGSSENFPHPGDIIVNVDEFTLLEKALMLYRHAKSAGLVDEGKFLVKNYWREIVENSYFTPLRISILINDLPEILKSVSLRNREAVIEKIKERTKEPTKHMEKVFNNLQGAHKKLLFAILDSGYSKEVEIERLKAAFNRHYTGIDYDFDAVLNDLNGTFIKIYRSEYPHSKSRELIKWIHPSMRDLAITMLERNLSLKNEFIKNCDINGILLLLSPRGNGETSPFLKDEKSWNTLLENINKKFADFRSSDFLDLLRNIEELKKVYEASPYEKYFLKFTKEVLEGAKNFIESEEKITQEIRGRIPSIDNRPAILNFYYKISRLIFNNKISSPDISYLWNDLYERAINILKTNWILEERLWVFENLIEMFKTLKIYDPGQLKRYSLHKKLLNLFLTYIAEIEKELRHEIWEDDPDIYFNEAEMWYSVADFSREIIDIFPEYEKKLRALIKKAENKASYYGYKAIQNTEDIEDGDIIYTTSPIRKTKDFDIAKIFDDL